jgi:tetratricopeptide (TPR) repeat protein
MTPERWQQIKDVFDAALKVASQDRAALLERECPGDPELRSEVIRLLSQHDGAGDFLNQPLIRTTSLVEGEVVANRYRIMAMIGRGGMGEVYEAKDQLLQETIALKTLRADYASGQAVVRFQREIQLARKVTHPNVCRVFEVGMHDFAGSSGAPLLFFTMEFLAGETLAARIRRKGRFSRAEAFPIAAQMADGLQAAHSAGIVHTDFKSSNVILVPSSSGERAVITDFGLARLDPTFSASDETRTLSAARPLAGTVAYMSPEQLTGRTLTAASDIYSFGIVLYQMATGQLPFDERHVIHSAMQRASGQGFAVRSLVPDLDPRWEAAIVRCLRKEPDRRFRSAGDLATYFRHSAWRVPVRYWTRREWVRASIAAGGPLGLATGLWLWITHPYAPRPAALDWYQKGLAALHSMTYEAARKALIQALAADPKFVVAHASLARAYDELDYTDLAKDSMLRAVTLAQDSWLTARDATRVRALQFMIARDYDRAAPLFRQLEDQAEEREKAAAALESGWLAQQREETEAAAAAYGRALKLDPTYAAAKLRLGYIQGRRRQVDAALKTFAEAEALYSASSDYEGVTETLLQRANLLYRSSRAVEAMPVIEAAISVARTVGNRYQEIRLQQLQGTAVRALGDVDRAAALAQQAIDAAITENMDNLAAVGLVDLGNAFLVRGDLKSAEPVFHRALDLARRGKVRRYEARALASLGSLCEQDRRPAEAKQFINSVLPFYRQAGYRREFVQASLLLGGVLEQLAEYEQGVRTLREALSSAVELQDSQIEVQVRERLADNLRRLGGLPEALAEYEKAVALLGSGPRSAGARLACAELYWQLGRRRDAERFVSDVGELLKKGQNQQLLSRLVAKRAEIALSQDRLGEAGAFLRQALSAVNRGGEAEPELSLIQALVLIRTGRPTEGGELSASVVEKLEKAELAGSAASARLSTAEAWMAAGNRSQALHTSRAALDFFEPRSILESAWRGHAVAAWAAEDRANAHMASGRSALNQLRSRWPAGAVDTYLQRPDTRRLLQLSRF